MVRIVLLKLSCDLRRRAVFIYAKLLSIMTVKIMLFSIDVIKETNPAYQV